MRKALGLLLGFGLVGTVSAAEIQSPVMTALSSTTISGYVDVAGIWSFNPYSPLVIPVWADYSGTLTITSPDGAPVLVSVETCSFSIVGCPPPAPYNTVPQSGEVLKQMMRRRYDSDGSVGSIMPPVAPTISTYPGAGADLQSVPEPATVGLMVLGLAGVAARLRRRVG